MIHRTDEPVVEAAPPKVSPATLRIVAQGGQILLPFEIGDAQVTFSRWRLAELIEAELGRATPRRQEIETGSRLEGFPGALWRLLGRCDLEQIEGWIKSEIVRGTPQVTILDCLSGAVASIALQMAGRVARPQMRQCAGQVMDNALKMLKRDLDELMEAKKADSVIRNRLRIVPGDRA